MKETMNRATLLNLPVSITSWIVLRDYAFKHADLEIFKKLIREYMINICPLFELESFFVDASSTFDTNDFQELVVYLFDQYHKQNSLQRRKR